MYSIRYNDSIFTDMKGDDGCAPVDIAVRNMSYAWKEGCIKVSLYLINLGCDSAEHKKKVLIRACKEGLLDVVMEIVKKHEVNPSGKGIVLVVTVPIERKQIYFKFQTFVFPLLYLYLSCQHDVN